MGDIHININGLEIRGEADYSVKLDKTIVVTSVYDTEGDYHISNLDRVLIADGRIEDFEIFYKFDKMVRDYQRENFEYFS